MEKQLSIICSVVSLCWWGVVLAAPPSHKPPQPARTIKAKQARKPIQRGAPQKAPTTKPPQGMVVITKGIHTPLYKTKRKKKTKVAAFWLDVYPVTNQAFHRFVLVKQRWRRSQVPRLFADVSYLKYWSGDLHWGSKKTAKSPVVRISWFAARRYCRWLGKRLPTVAEWEYVAAASKTQRKGNREPGYNARILGWYSRPTPKVLPAVGTTFKNVWGVYDMHGLVWEWTRNFHSALVTGESRADSALERKLFCGAGSAGSSDFKNYAAFMRYAFRSSLKANYTTANLGFRCAKSIPTTTKRRLR